jgi:hypothetical protein
MEVAAPAGTDQDTDSKRNRRPPTEAASIVLPIVAERLLRDRAVQRAQQVPEGLESQPDLERPDHLSVPEGRQARPAPQNIQLT